MNASEGKLGRVFLLRLETGDAAVPSIEDFAREKGVHAGHVFLVAKQAMVGIIAPDSQGMPRLRFPLGLDESSLLESKVVVQELLGINF